MSGFSGFLPGNTNHLMPSSGDFVGQSAFARGLDVMDYMDQMDDMDVVVVGAF